MAAQPAGVSAAPPSFESSATSSPSLGNAQFQAGTDCCPRPEQKQAADEAQHQMSAANIRTKVAFVNPSSHFKTQGNTSQGTTVIGANGCLKK